LRSFLPDAQETSRNWENGPHDTPCLVTHYEGFYQYYYADLAWHEFHGPEPDLDDVIQIGPREVPYREARLDFQIIRRAQTEALQQIRPGMDHVQAKAAVNRWMAADPEVRRRVHNYFIHGIGLEVHEEPVIVKSGGRPPIPLEGPIYFRPGAVVSFELFTRLWTVEEPFVMTENRWEPMVELRGLTKPTE